MNFSRITIPIPEHYLTQDETDILVEISRLNGEKHKIPDEERRFYDATISKSKLL